jgi:hypothetical protein
VSIRVEIAGVTVRLFGERRDAINEANARTRLRDQQHHEMKIQLGYLVKNVVTGEFFDATGPLPEKVMDALLGKFIVICREDRDPDGTLGRFALATHQVFDSEEEAHKYALGVSSSREPMVIPGQFDRLRLTNPAKVRSEETPVQRDLSFISEAYALIDQLLVRWEKAGIKMSVVPQDLTQLFSMRDYLLSARETLRTRKPVQDTIASFYKASRDRESP